MKPLHPSMKAYDRCHKELLRAYDLEWKKHSPKRANLNKKEDIKLVKQRKKELFDSRAKLYSIISRPKG